MRLSEIKHPLTIDCVDNSTVRIASKIVGNFFSMGKGQILAGIVDSNTIINITDNVYYTQNKEYAECDIYTLSEIDELKHLSKTN
jgi:hypothetical protein